jgi:hypothetical protein
VTSPLWNVSAASIRKDPFGSSARGLEVRVSKNGTNELNA